MRNPKRALAALIDQTPKRPQKIIFHFAAKGWKPIRSARPFLPESRHTFIPLFKRRAVFRTNIRQIIALKRSMERGSNLRKDVLPIQNIRPFQIGCKLITQLSVGRDFGFDGQTIAFPDPARSTTLQQKRAITT